MFGHEVDGISPALLERCATHVRIPTLGTKQSINVATAGGVVLYELLRKYRRRLEGTQTADGRQYGGCLCRRRGPRGPRPVTAEMLPAVSSPA
ncbi:MAG: TrmH family RNA methyltransferase [Acidobacteriota bacterium]